MKHKDSCIVFRLLVLTLFLAVASFAQVTLPDPAFGLNGSMRNFISGGNNTGDEAYSVVIQPDGKIVAGGCSYDGSGDSFALARYNADGSPDITFGTNGSVRSSIAGGFSNRISSIALQPDGKILACGQSYDASYNRAFAVARYTADGTPDTAFGTNGSVRHSISGSSGTIDEATSVAVQADGKILAGGGSVLSANWVFAFARYNTNGTLDSTFGINGSLRSPIAGSASSIALQSDGKIVAGGSYNSEFRIARFKSDGTVDSTFGTNGSTTHFISGGDESDDYLESIAIQTDGKIVAGGYSYDGSYYAFALARYNTDGTLDNTFSTDGTVRSSISGGDGTYDCATSVAIQSDGKIVAGGYSYNGSYEAFALARYNTDGSLDSTFGTNGSMRSFISGGSNQSDCGNSIAIQPDGKIVAIGSSADASGKQAFAVARYGEYPVVITVLPPTVIGTSSATLHGTVTPFGVTTGVRFLWGTAHRVYTDSSSAATTVSSTGADPVSDALSGLEAGRTYYYTISTISSEGYYQGEEKTFMTFSPLPGNALVFDGGDDYVQFAYDSVYNLSAVTIEMWFKWAHSGTATEFLITNSNEHLEIHLGGSLSNGIRFIPTPGVYLDSPSEAFTPSTWVHLACVYDPSESLGKIYVNGTDVGTTNNGPNPLSTPIASSSPTSTMIFGVRSGGPYPYKGAMDEVRIWNIARDSTDIRAHMHRVCTSEHANLVGYWPLNEGSAGTTRNFVRDNDGLLHNFAFDETSGWVNSTIPAGDGTSVSVPSFTSGMAEFGDLTLTAIEPFDNAVELVCTPVLHAPNEIPSEYPSVAGDQFCVLNVFGTPGTFSANLTFNFGPGVIDPRGDTYPAGIILYKRSSTSDGTWTLVRSADSVASATGVVRFDSVTSFSQFAIVEDEAVLPVVLTSLTASTSEHSVQLAWRTATEVDNFGFEIERRVVQDSKPGDLEPGTWSRIAFVPGGGTTTSPRLYSFVDKPGQSGRYAYRIKQIDNAGAFVYTSSVEIEIGVPQVFSLSQNYPNPFNPTTTISYQLPREGHVRLFVYDNLGRQVRSLVDGVQSAGYYSLVFDVTGLPSGIYFYRLVSGSFSQTRKLLIIR